MPVDIAIIGGGIAGAAAGYALGRRGMSVAIIDADDGRAASGNPIGLIMPWLSRGGGPPRDFHDAAWHYTQQLLKILAVPVDYEGIIQLPPNEKEAERFRQLAVQKVFDESDMQYCDAAQLTALAETTITGDGLYFPRAVALSPAILITALTVRCHRVNTMIQSLNYRDNYWYMFDVAGEEVCRARHVVLATGWRDALLQHYLPDVIRPRRGQLTSIPQDKLPALARPIVCGNYLTPGVGGQLVLGATYQHTTTDDVTAADHWENLNALRQFTQVPALAAAAQYITPAICTGRAAVRATTMNHLPVVGRLANVENLYVITGLGSRGLLTAPLLGEILAAQITQAVLPVARATYAQLSPARFNRAN